MEIKANYKKIEIGRIDRDDLDYLLAPVCESFDSIEATEEVVHRKIMLTPPLLQAKGEGFRIITGHDIFRQFTDKPANATISCLVISDEAGQLELLALALEHISISRKPSPVEEATCLDKAIKGAGRENALSFFKPLLSMTRRYDPDTLTQLLELDDEKLEALHNNRLELSTAFSILGMNKTDRDEVFRFIVSLKLSSSNQRKFVRSFHELARRRDISIMEVINDDTPQRILQDQSLDLPKKTAQVMNWLNRQLFPKLSGAEDDFQKFTQQLDLPKNSEIKHATSFEKDSITFSITFSDRERFIDKLPKLKEIIEK